MLGTKNVNRVNVCTSNVSSVLALNPAALGLILSFGISKIFSSIPDAAMRFIDGVA